MFKGIFLGFWALESALAVPLQHPLTSPPTLLNPYPEKKRLTFRADGTFKITIFSDLHFGENPGDGIGPVKDRNSTRLMRAILRDEEPDYVVLNGDLVTGDYTFKENSTLLIDQIMTPLIEAKIAFSSTHGNHDNQVNITHLDEIAREQAIAPHLCYTRAAPPGIGGIGGPGNYWVPIYETPTALAPALVLWFFDSRGGISPSGTPLPDWVDASVAPWIAHENVLMDAVWGPAPRGALAFVHIAPHAIQAVQLPVNSTVDPDTGLNDDPLGGGSVQDSLNIAESEIPFASASQENSPDHDDSFNLAAARDAPFWSALGAIPNLHAVISGHAHGNEWCARASGVRFCFNKHSGYGGYDKDGWGYGVRNVVFSPLPADESRDDPRIQIDGDSSQSPLNAVETWIRLESGETRARLVLSGPSAV
ncbi:Metallo-dependent phosphatase-like protein [Mycena capillaripes]|nr:Metallo-dependent phosphatase-like protein [Mycena capillaripes]